MITGQGHSVVVFEQLKHFTLFHNVIIIMTICPWQII